MFCCFFHLKRKRVFETCETSRWPMFQIKTWTGTGPKIVFFYRNGGCYRCCATMWSLSTGILFQSSRNCQSCQIWPAKFWQILIRTDTRLVFCNTKLMRTDIILTRTTKPICNFANSAFCWTITGITSTNVPIIIIMCQVNVFI